MAGGDSAAVSAEGSAAAGGAGDAAVTQPRPVGLAAVAAARKLMPPPAPRAQQKRKPQKVLDEDEWTARLDKIITRDYFPDVPKLKNKLEWLEATRSGRGLHSCRFIQRDPRA
jgi:protein DGCR14